MNMRTPFMVMVPKTPTVAPPMTGCGIAERTAEMQEQAGDGKDGRDDHKDPLVDDLVGADDAHVPGQGCWWEGLPSRPEAGP